MDRPLRHDGLQKTIGGVEGRRGMRKEENRNGRLFERREIVLGYEEADSGLTWLVCTVALKYVIGQHHSRRNNIISYGQVTWQIETISTYC